MYDINKNIRFEENFMKELINFFKEIFMLTDENSKLKIGLSQFKGSKQTKQPSKRIKKFEKDVKLSDLMRRSA